MRAPAQTTPDVLPQLTPAPFERISAGPESFGGLVGQATQRAGGELNESSDRISQALVYRQQLINETAAQQSLNALENAQADHLHNPQTGYLTKRGQAAVNGYPDAVSALNDMYTQYRAALPNDAARRLFDSQAMRSTRYAVMQAGSHADNETKTWMDQTADGAIQNIINTGALTWNDPDRVEYNLGRISAQTLAKGELHGASQDTVSAWTSHYQSEFLSAVVRQAMTHDMGTAQALLDKYRPQMDANHQATLDQQFESRKYTDMMRQIANENRLEAQAERHLRQSQETNFSDLFAKAMTGAPIENGYLAEAVRTQQITPQQLKAIQAEQAGRAKTDDPSVVADLQRRADRGEDISNDIADAIAAGQMKSTTGISLVRGAMARQQKGDDQVEKAAFATLRSAMGFDANMQPMVDFGHEFRAEQIGLWTQAQQEWTRRVLQGNEKPMDVLPDMLAEYARPSQPPPSWPQPKFGAVQSSDDVTKVLVQTKAALDAGQITPDEYAHQTHLLKLYDDHFDLEQRKAAALASAPKAKAGVVKKDTQ